MKKQGYSVQRTEKTFPSVAKYIYQPNRVTEAYYDFKLIQERIFNAVKFQLQEAISKRMSGEDYTQLELFTDYNSNDIVLNISLRDVAKKQQYPIVREACKQLAGLVVSLPYKDKFNNERRIRYTGLLRADMPQEASRTSSIRIYMEKQVARFLIEIDRDENNMPINYTKYHYEVIKKSRKKYTPRIYMFLCSWKSKGYKTVSLSEFRVRLGIENKYKHYRDIKKYILEPVQADLIRIKADCWFDCNNNGFEIKERNTVTHLNFQIITPKLNEDFEKKREYVRWLLKTYFSFNENHFFELKELIERNNPYELIEKIDYLNKKVKEKRTEEIANIQNYVIHSLKNEFRSS